MSFFGGLYNIPSAQIAARQAHIFPRLKLASHEQSLIRELPSGIKQRVALACSLLHDPDIIFLDEPTAGVDLLNRQVFWELIRELAAEGKTLFVTSHYLDEMEHAHHVGFIDRGKLIGFDTPLGLKIAFADGYRVRLLHTDPQVLTRAATSLQVQGYHVEIDTSGEVYALLVESSSSSLDRFRRDLHPLDPTLDCTAALPSIEDVFTGMIRQQRAAQEHAA